MPPREARPRSLRGQTRRAVLDLPRCLTQPLRAGVGGLAPRAADRGFARAARPPGPAASRQPLPAAREQPPAAGPCAPPLVPGVLGKTGTWMQRDISPHAPFPDCEPAVCRVTHSAPGSGGGSLFTPSPTDARTMYNRVWTRSTM